MVPFTLAVPPEFLTCKPRIEAAVTLGVAKFEVPGIWQGLDPSHGAAADAIPEKKSIRPLNPNKVRKRFMV
jgi:hypothetical protein